MRRWAWDVVGSMVAGAVTVLVALLLMSQCADASSEVERCEEAGGEWRPEHQGCLGPPSHLIHTP